MPFSAGTNIHFCSKDIELDCPVEKQDFLSGACFGKASTNFQAPPPPPVSVVKKKFVSPAMNAASSLSRNSRPSRVALQDANATVVAPVEEDDSSSKLKESHWTVNWYPVAPISVGGLRLIYDCRRKQQTKKHKTWDGDAYISFVSGQIKVVSETGKPRVPFNNLFDCSLT
jgi:DNA repair and recombination protein RAD54B